MRRREPLRDHVRTIRTSGAGGAHTYRGIADVLGKRAAEFDVVLKMDLAVQGVEGRMEVTGKRWFDVETGVYLQGTYRGRGTALIDDSRVPVELAIDEVLSSTEDWTPPPTAESTPEAPASSEVPAHLRWIMGDPAAARRAAKPGVAEWQEVHAKALEAYRGYRHAEADRLFREALKLAEAVDPPDFRLAATLNDIGLNYHFQDLHAEAERYLNQALQVWLRSEGPESQGTANTLNNLGESYRKQRRYAEAEDAHRRALALRERLLTPHHVDVGISFLNLGLVADDQRRDGEAEEFYGRAIRLFEGLGSFAAVGLGEALHNFGVLRQRQGRTREAIALLERALAIRYMLYGAEPTRRELVRTCTALTRILEADRSLSSERAAPCRTGDAPGR